jgi:ketosteroid isomerase-like protein
VDQADILTSEILASESLASDILALERGALERWGRGDPSGFEEISAPEVTYFDPFTETRLDGIGALRSWYDQIRGKIHIERFEILDPHVQVHGEAAVLTYRFVSHGSEGSMHWNATEVYRRSEAGWRIIHTHWAFHKPKLGQASI